MITVTGATGNVGSQAVRELIARGLPARAFVRDGATARALLGEEVEIVEGDFGDPGSLRRALAGAEKVFLASADGPEKIAHELAVIDAAAASGVRLVVKCSTIGAEPGSASPPFDWHGRIEEALRRSGLPTVVLRSCFYMTNLLASADQVRSSGKLFAPAGPAGIAMIDPRDTGAVAAAVLSGDGHEGRTYVLTGPESITYAHVAKTLGQATGGSVDYVDVPDDALREGLVAAGMPDWLVTHLGALFPLIREGALAETTDTVPALLGRAARRFDEFAREHATAFRVAVPVG